MAFDFEQFKKSFLEEFNVGDEQVRAATRKARELKNQAVDSTKLQSMLQSYRTGQVAKNIGVATLKDANMLPKPEQIPEKLFGTDLLNPRETLFPDKDFVRDYEIQMTSKL